MESERITRKRRIDPLLKSLGWKIVPFEENCPLDQLSNCAIEEYETENGPADYVLCVEGRIVAVSKLRNSRSDRRMYVRRPNVTRAELQ